MLAMLEIKRKIVFNVVCHAIERMHRRMVHCVTVATTIGGILHINSIKYPKKILRNRLVVEDFRLLFFFYYSLSLDCARLFVLKAKATHTKSKNTERINLIKVFDKASKFRFLSVESMAF